MDTIPWRYQVSLVTSSLIVIMLSASLIDAGNFILPSTQISKLARTVSGPICGSAKCKQPVLDEITCSTYGVCSLTCPTRLGFPNREDPQLNWTKSGICEESNHLPPGVTSFPDSNYYMFAVNSSFTTNCTFSSTVTTPTLALSMWFSGYCSSNCSLAWVNNVATLLISNNHLCLGPICIHEEIVGDKWTHIVLQVGFGKAYLIVNGNTTNAAASIQISSISGPISLSVGLTNGNTQSNYSYTLYDVRYYSDLLTDREIAQLYTGIFPDAGMVNSCRCPDTHLSLKAGDTYTCVNKSMNEVKRLTISYNSANAMIDDNEATAWLGPDDGEFTLIIDLQNTYQINEIVVSFQNMSIPTNMDVHLHVKDTSTVSCSQFKCIFTLGQLSPDVGRDQFLTRVAQTFNLTFSPNRIQTPGLTHVIITDLSVTGWCNCNGNTQVCDNSTIPYTCRCSSGTFSQGAHCDGCFTNRYRLNSTQFDCQGICSCGGTGVSNTSQMCELDGGACICKSNVGGAKCDSCLPWMYNFSSSNPDGCSKCSCVQNGSLSCNNSTGECFCKANVRPPKCDECMMNFYDVGPDIGPDQCVPCGCNQMGVLNQNVTCNVVTGQCNCKQYVQGRQCNECKDGYYKLDVVTSTGCQPCSCHAIGSNSSICDKVSGQCLCHDNVTTDRICSPGDLSAWPLFGPLNGSTIVTISGKLLGDSTTSQPGVFLDNESQPILHHNQSSIVFKTLSSTKLGARLLRVSWDDVSDSITVGNFSYKPDPLLNEALLPNVSMFISGGCGVIFKGSNLNSVASPLLIVKDITHNQSKSGECHQVNSDTLCITPDFSGIIQNPSGTYRYGLQFDGVKYNDLGPVKMQVNPKITNIGDIKFQFPFARMIKLSGSGLLGPCKQQEITVTIGVLRCGIRSLTDSEIECKPPTNRPGSVKNYAIMVNIGSNIQQQAGTLVYLEAYETDGFIGIMCGIGGLILIIVVITVLCLCRRRRSRAMNSISTSKLVEVPTEANGGQKLNEYTELTPTVSKPVSNEIIVECIFREPKPSVPTVQDVDSKAEFLKRLESNLLEPVKAAIITASDLTLGQLCTAKGNYARIINGTFAKPDLRTEILVTIKMLKDPLPDDKPLPDWATSAISECIRLRHCSHDNVLSIIGIAPDKHRFHIVYPSMANRTLKDYVVDATKEFSKQHLLEYGLQVVEGLDYLHSSNLVHKDLAARNCMVDGLEVVKISDSAFSWDLYENEYVFDKARGRYLPVRWMAPESLMNGFYDTRSDIWSMGVLIWELLTRCCLPFHEVTDDQISTYIKAGYRLGQPQNCSDKLYDLMRLCWSTEEITRPHTAIIINHLSEELTGESEEIYVNIDKVQGFYENEATLGMTKRKAPAPPPPNKIK